MWNKPQGTCVTTWAPGSTPSRGATCQVSILGTKPSVTGDYDAAANGGVSYEDAMKVMTVVRGDGTTSTGMAAFEDMYGAVKLGWVFSFLKYRAVRRFFDSAYDFWAAYRLPGTLAKPPCT